MTTQTTSLTDFLLARIAEREAHIRADIVGRSYDDPGFELAECEAKRRIVERCALVIQAFEDGIMWSNVNRRERSHARQTIRTLAAVYADHPDFREEWRAAG